MEILQSPEVNMVLYTEMINKKNWGQLDRRAKQCVPEQLNIKLKYANQQNKCYPCKIKKLTEKKKKTTKKPTGLVVLFWMYYL